MNLLSIGGGNYVNYDRLISAVAPESAPIKRLITDAREHNMLIDATYGKRTKSVLIMDTGHVVLSFKEAKKFLSEKNVDSTDENSADNADYN
jgi:regulator of extracellular matrix RemA (YlzA/DUF370 family)